jgi:hypothetical protein
MIGVSVKQVSVPARRVRIKIGQVGDLVHLETCPTYEFRKL